MHVIGMKKVGLFLKKYASALDELSKAFLMFLTLPITAAVLVILDLLPCLDLIDLSNSVYQVTAVVGMCCVTFCFGSYKLILSVYQFIRIKFSGKEVQQDA